MVEFLSSLRGETEIVTLSYCTQVQGKERGCCDNSQGNKGKTTVTCGKAALFIVISFCSDTVCIREHFFEEVVK